MKVSARWAWWVTGMLMACDGPHEAVPVDSNGADAGVPLQITEADGGLARVVAFFVGSELDLELGAKPDAGFDAGFDAGVDAGVDAGRDAGFDAGVDAGRDAGVDAGRDAGVDAGRDAGFDAGVDAGRDAGFDAGFVFDAGPGGPRGALVYSGDRTQSPIDVALVNNLESIAARGNGRGTVFSKVGDSISTNGPGVGGGLFLNCFDGFIDGQVSWEINVRLGAYSALEPTIHYFRTTRIGSDDSWTRASLSTQSSRTAEWAISGSPAPVDQEVNAANPRYAVVMYGSNDIVWTTALGLLDAAEIYERNMRTLTDRLISRGVIPLLTTMPPDIDGRRYVPVYSGVVRAIAQGRQVPLIDYYRELMAIGPPYGLSSDGVHPICQNYNTCCWFDSNSLSQYGYNIRNLITLQALDRMHRVFDLGVNTLDPQAPRQFGDGSTNSPYLIPSLPYGELRDLRSSPWRPSGQLSCSGAPSVSGPQNLYRMVLTRTTSLRIVVLDGGARAQRVSLLSSQSPSSCLLTGQRMVATTLSPGTYYVLVNANNSGGGAEYNLSVTECLPGDPDC